MLKSHSFVNEMDYFTGESDDTLHLFLDWYHQIMVEYRLSTSRECVKNQGKRLVKINWLYGI